MAPVILSKINNLLSSFHESFSNSVRNGKITQKEWRNESVEEYARRVHEKWRRSWEEKNGLGAVRMKWNSDNTYGNINVPYDHLHPDWQKENLLAGEAALNAVLYYLDEDMAAEYCHLEWIRRNKKMIDLKLCLCYDFLPQSEKRKNADSVFSMRQIVFVRDLTIFSTATQLHDHWRKFFKLNHPDQKKFVRLSDGSFSDMNVPFLELHAELQKEYLLDSYAARAAWEKSPNDAERAAAFAHKDWCARHKFSPDIAHQHVPFHMLQEGDKNRVRDLVHLVAEEMSNSDPLVQEVAAELHEDWRVHFHSLPHHNAKTKRIKLNSDGSTCNINVNFYDLHPDWKQENIMAARAAKNAIDKFGNDIELVANDIHEKWMQRNPKTDYNAHLHISYNDLPEQEKEKDRRHARIMESCIEKNKLRVVGGHRLTEEEYLVTQLIDVVKKIGFAETKKNLGRFEDDPDENEIDILDVKDAETVNSMAQNENSHCSRLSSETLRELNNENLISKLLNPSVQSFDMEESKRDDISTISTPSVSIAAKFISRGQSNYSNHNNSKFSRGISDENYSSELDTKTKEEIIIGNAIVNEKILVNPFAVDPRDKSGMNAVCYAARYGLTLILSQLLSHSESLSASQIDASSQIITPSQTLSSSSSQKLQKLHLPDKIANINTPSKCSMTPLLWAVYAGHVDAVTILAKKGADIYQSDSSGLTPLMWSVLASPSPSSGVSMTQTLIELVPRESSSRLLEAADCDGMTALHHAANTCRFAHVRALVEAGALVNARDKNGWTPLHYSVNKGLTGDSSDEDTSVLYFLLDNKADCYAADLEGLTPLHIACLRGKRAHVTLLIRDYDVSADADADIDVIPFLQNSQSNKKPMLNVGKISTTPTPLHLAIENGHIHVVKFLLANHADVTRGFVKNASDLNQKSKRRTAVVIAAEKSRGDMIKAILTDSKIDDSRFMEEIIRNFRKKISQKLYDCFLQHYSPVKTGWKAVNPYGPQRFNKMWKLRKNEFVTLGSNDFAPDCLWRKFRDRIDELSLFNFEKLYYFFKSGIETEVTSFTVDIPYSASPRFIRLFLMLDRSAHTKIFEQDFVKVSIQHAWNSYGWKNHLFDVFVYLGYLIVASVTNYTFNSSPVQELKGNPDLAWPIVILVLSSLIMLGRMLQQIYNNRKHPWRFFSSYHPYVELCCYCLTLIGCSLRLHFRAETDSSSSIMAVATVLSFVKINQLVRPYRQFGHLIANVEAVIIEVRYFLLYFWIVLFGFSQAIFLLSWNEPTNDNFGHPDISLVQTFKFVAGNTSYPPFGVSNSSVALLLLVVLFVIANFILLNMLIALMGLVTTAISEKKEAMWRRKVCETISLQLTGFAPFPMTCEKYIHYLKRDLDIPKPHSSESIKSTQSSDTSDANSSSSSSVLNRNNASVFGGSKDSNRDIKVDANTETSENQSSSNKFLYNLDSPRLRLSSFRTFSNVNLPSTPKLNSTLESFYPTKNASQKSFWISKDDESCDVNDNNLSTLKTSSPSTETVSLIKEIEMRDVSSANSLSSVTSANANINTSKSPLTPIQENDSGTENSTPLGSRKCIFDSEEEKLSEDEVNHAIDNLTFDKDKEMLSADQKQESDNENDNDLKRLI